jgi:hypothetical protein
MVGLTFMGSRLTPAAFPMFCPALVVGTAVPVVPVGDFFDSSNSAFLQSFRLARHDARHFESAPLGFGTLPFSKESNAA